MQYQLIFCLWSLTYQKEIAAEIHRKCDILLPLIDIAKSAIKEKVVRIIFSTFRVSRIF